jgi:hypothetical protein
MLGVRHEESPDRMPAIRLIGIDADLGRVVEDATDDFADAYGASLGEGGLVVREVVSQTLAAR